MIHPTDVVGKAFESGVNCAVDREGFDTVVEVETKYLGGAGREVKASKQIVTRFVENLMLQERGIHLSCGVFKVFSAWSLAVRDEAKFAFGPGWSQRNMARSCRRRTDHIEPEKTETQNAGLSS